jgi:hypothetical protein
MFDRSNFVPTVLPDAALFAPLTAASSEPSMTESTALQGGLRSRRGFQHGPGTGNTDVNGSLAGTTLTGATFPTANSSPKQGPGSGGGGLRGLAPAVVAAPSTSYGRGRGDAKPSQQPFISGSASATAYTYTAQQVAQYHTASSRADEQQHVEATVVEIGGLREFADLIFADIFKIAGSSLSLMQATCSRAWQQ